VYIDIICRSRIDSCDGGTSKRKWASCQKYITLQRLLQKRRKVFTLVVTMMLNKQSICYYYIDYICRLRSESLIELSSMHVCMRLERECKH
jgi:hypothetical protein